MDALSVLGLSSPAKTTQLDRFTPGQKNIQDQLLNRAYGQLNSNQFDFAPIEQQARTNFTQSTIPAITNQFNSPGGEGLRSSSFLGALGRAGSGLESNLASQKSNYNLKQQQLIQQLVSLGMQPQFESYYEPESNALGDIGSLLASLGLYGAASGGAGGTGGLLASGATAAASPLGGAALGGVVGLLALKNYLNKNKEFNRR